MTKLQGATSSIRTLGIRASRLRLSAIGLAFAAMMPPAHADWHFGTITDLGVAYDGSTVAFLLSGWVRTNCTCYASWPSEACLDRTRTSFREEYALLLSAKRVGQTVGINIDETTCKVIAIDEST